MAKEIKDTAAQMWKDFITCAGLLLSFCGVLNSAVTLVKAISPDSKVEGLPTSPKR